MKKILKLLKVLRLVLRRPYLLNNVITDPEVNHDYVVNEYGLHQGLPTVDILNLFENFKETVEPYCFLEGGSLPTDLALLKAFAKNIENCSYLEIGSWRGESLANVSSVAKECVSLNLSEKEMKDLGLKEEYIKQHFLFSKNLPNVTHIGHNSLSFDFSSLKRKFDLIFIDGDHHYESVKSDTKNAFSLLKDKNSVIVWHDYALSTESVRWEVLAGILDGCPEENRKNLYHVSNTLCAIFINKKLKSSYTEYPTRPNKIFKVEISAERIV